MLSSFRRTIRWSAAVALLCAGLVQGAPAQANASKAVTSGAKRAPSRASTSAAPSAAPEPKSPPQLPAELQRLGPLSVGHPHQGYLLNARKMPTSPRWVLTVPSHGYGTDETVEQLTHCLNQVHERFPGSPKVMLGSISAQYGGVLPPHQSHRTGRDADVYFFRKPGAQWSKAATKDDIDLPRTWAMLRCFITETDVDMILIVRRVQDWIEEYALSIGEPAEWIRGLFHDQGRYKTAVVRDVPGHVAHMHVRFTSPAARRRAIAVYDRLVALGAVVPPKQAITHEVQRGDTLSHLAKRYATSVARIQAQNDLRGTLIKVGQRLLLSKAVDLREARGPVVVPPRRRPPREAELPRLDPVEAAVAGVANQPDQDDVANASPASPPAVLPRAPSPPAEPQPAQVEREPKQRKPTRSALQDPWAAKPRPERPRWSRREAEHE